jgi:hypothetical protein
MHTPVLTNNQLNPSKFFTVAIDDTYKPTATDVAFFDQTGYSLTQIEQRYARANQAPMRSYLDGRISINEYWYTQDTVIEGPTLNHSMLFERKGYTEEALEQLQRKAQDLPLLYKIINIRSKWGLDFSMDYVDRAGNSFEIIHWEWDTFDHGHAMETKSRMEALLNSIDWSDAARQLIRQKEEWHGKDYFVQSDWKCDYFGIPKEQFKMIIW